MRRTVLCVLGAALLCGVGCQRALWVVREEGDRAFKRGEYEQARAEYAEVAERDPADWDYRVKLAETLLQLGEPARAREHLAVVHSVRPDDDEVFESLAEATYRAGEYDDLITLLQRRASDRQRASDHLLLGEYAQRVGDADTAERALLTAARIDGGESAAPQIALADFYESLGDEGRALRRLRMALYIEPESESLRQRIRAYGEVPGPSFAIVPDEAR